MRFMDRVITPNGPGLVIGRVRRDDTPIGILVTIARRDLVGKTCAGPCANLIFREAEVARVDPEEFARDKGWPA